VTAGLRGSEATESELKPYWRGDKAKATAGFQDFIKREPQHPLAKDAEQAIAALR
jgi:TolA-binding protein